MEAHRLEKALTDHLTLQGFKEFTIEGEMGDETSFTLVARQEKLTKRLHIRPRPQRAELHQLLLSLTTSAEALDLNYLVFPRQEIPSTIITLIREHGLGLIFVDEEGKIEVFQEAGLLKEEIPAGITRRVLSGMRPTGKLHLGHLVGALTNWKRLQDEMETFYMVADWHALTTDYANPSQIKESIKEMVLDWLCCGLDPEKSTLFIQSHVPEHAELHLLFSMFVPLAHLERNPTYKEALQEIKDKELHTYGFLGYPVLQAADILIYKATHVPVGEDQLPHLELTRRIARWFNSLYGEVFPIPRAELTIVPFLPGIDGRKMSKSYGNAILLSEDEKSIKEKVFQMLTDPARKRRSDPGNPDICTLHRYHSLLGFKEGAGTETDLIRFLREQGFDTSTTYEEVERIAYECRNALIGCVDHKKILAQRLNQFIQPMRARRDEFERTPGLVEDILSQGEARARPFAQETMRDVREAMGI